MKGLFTGKLGRKFTNLTQRQVLPLFAELKMMNWAIEDHAGTKDEIEHGNLALPHHVLYNEDGDAVVTVSAGFFKDTDFIWLYVTDHKGGNFNKYNNTVAVEQAVNKLWEKDLGRKRL